MAMKKDENCREAAVYSQLSGIYAQKLDARRFGCTVQLTCSVKAVM